VVSLAGLGSPHSTTRQPAIDLRDRDVQRRPTGINVAICR
jgi:hypothetical protein